MVTLKAVQESNAALRSTVSGQVALFVGATSGIARSTLTEYARRSDRPKVYIVGRSDTKLSSLIGELERINPQGSYVPIRAEISLLKNVDDACEEYKRMEKSLDLLVMCPGYLKLSRIDNADGLEDTFSLNYYVRMRFLQNLLPQLSAALSARVVNIHTAGKEGHLNEADLELKHTFSLVNARVHSATMTTLAMIEIASSEPSISWIHVHPSLIISGAFNTFAEDWYFPLRFLFLRVLVPILKLFTVGLPESGQRHLFHATSARYPPAGVKDPPGAGVPLPDGMEVARGADWKEGTGCYLLNWDGEAIGDRKLLEEYRKKDMGKKIWEHTQGIFERVLGKA